MSTVDIFGKELNMPFKLGDIVKRKEMIGEIIFIDETDACYPYLVGIKGFQGQKLSDSALEELSIEKGYEHQCQWFMSDEIEAAEKPSKPIAHPIYDFICPVCKSYEIYRSADHRYFAYCPDCGQKLDWNDIDNKNVNR